MKRKLLIGICLLNFAFSQSQNWLGGGNLPGGPNGINAANNILGTQANFGVRFHTNSVQRIFIKDANNNYPGGNNGGYVSIGNPPAAAPLFNLSVLTQSVGSSGGGFGGDFLIGGSTTKSPNSFMGLVDVSATANTFVPTYIGSLDAMQQGPAISTVGNIDGAQDLASNNFPVHRFIVGTGFTPYTRHNIT